MRIRTRASHPAHAHGQHESGASSPEESDPLLAHTGQEPGPGGTSDGKIDDEVARYASATRVHVSADDSDRLLDMIDRRILYIMMATYFLQTLDKGTMSFASIMGLPQDTRMVEEDGETVSQEYSWLSTCIYLVILAVEYPQNYIIARVPIAKYLGFSIISWGIVLAFHASCTNFKGLLTVRCLLGLFESVCQPAFVVLSSIWYRREEQASRITYWYMMNGAQQIVGGLIAYFFSLISSGPLKSWQWLFLVYGAISVMFGIFVLFWMPDSPMRAKCFSEKDKRLMIERVRDNQTGIQNRTFKKHQLYEALRDPQMWCYGAIQLFTTLPSNGLGAYANIIINKGLGFNVLQTQLLTMVLGAYTIFLLVGTVKIVNRWNENILISLIFLIPSFIGTILLMTIPNNTFSQHVGLLIPYYITMSYWSAQTLALSMLSRNVGGQTKKTVVVAGNFMFWCIGNAIGPQMFRPTDSPRYYFAFATHLGCYSVVVLVLVYFRWHLTRENRKRDQLGAAGIGEAHDENMTHAFEDLTDCENPNFRYVY